MKHLIKLVLLSILLVPLSLAQAETKEAAALAPAGGLNLGDGDKCEAGKDCTCVHVTCKEGCTCDIQFGIGICIDCPIPETPPSIVVTLSPEVYRRVASVAAGANATVEGVVSEGIREYLDIRDMRDALRARPVATPLDPGACVDRCRGEVFPDVPQCAARCDAACAPE